MAFTSTWAIFVEIYATLAPRYLPKITNIPITITLDTITMMVWLAAFTALKLVSSTLDSFNSTRLTSQHPKFFESGGYGDYCAPEQIAVNFSICRISSSDDRGY